jgi:uncharacterized coiled-coil protein SlyX
LFGGAPETAEKDLGHGRTTQAIRPTTAEKKHPMAKKKEDNVEQRLDRMDCKLDSLDVKFEKLSQDVASMITLMNQNQEEIRRLFGVKGEDHALKLKGIGEGYRINRERLDDHEGRISKLEAS